MVYIHLWNMSINLSLISIVYICFNWYNKYLNPTNHFEKKNKVLQAYQIPQRSSPQGWIKCVLLFMKIFLLRCHSLSSAEITANLDKPNVRDIWLSPPILLCSLHQVVATFAEGNLKVLTTVIVTFRLCFPTLALLHQSNCNKSCSVTFIFTLTLPS